ncbi:CMP191.5L [Camelpox virus CMS]|uniref:CMP191.5L n=1 Tax=Camelpox virus (strain CMS) TaxID=203172 RepID=Q8QQ02_CAMPS|nr:CMP191.5L [Camelpox virus CMS]
MLGIVNAIHVNVVASSSLTGLMFNRDVITLSYRSYRFYLIHLFYRLRHHRLLRNTYHYLSKRRLHPLWEVSTILYT